MSSLVNSSSGTGTDQGPIALSEPASVAAGDVLYLLLHIDNSISITDPSGWTLLNAWDSTSHVRLYRVVRGGSAPGLSVVFTAGGNRRWEWHMSAWRGVDNTTPEAATAYNAITTASPTNPNCPAVTTTDTNQTVIAFGTGNDGATTVWSLAGYTVLTTISGGFLAIGYNPVAAAGSEDPPAFSGSSAGLGDITEGTVALKDAAAGGGSSIGLPTSFHPGRSPGLGGISSARFQTNWWPYPYIPPLAFDPAFMSAMEKHGNDPLVLPPHVVASGMTPPEQMPT